MRPGRRVQEVTKPRGARLRLQRAAPGQPEALLLQAAPKARGAHLPWVVPKQRVAQLRQAEPWLQRVVQRRTREEPVRARSTLVQVAPTRRQRPVRKPAAGPQQPQTNPAEPETPERAAIPQRLEVKHWVEPRSSPQLLVLRLTRVAVVAAQRVRLTHHSDAGVLRCSVLRCCWGVGGRAVALDLVPPTGNRAKPLQRSVPAASRYAEQHRAIEPHGIEPARE